MILYFSIGSGDERIVLLSSAYIVFQMLFLLYINGIKSILGKRITIIHLIAILGLLLAGEIIGYVNLLMNVGSNSILR